MKEITESSQKITGNSKHTLDDNKSNQRMCSQLSGMGTLVKQFKID